MSPSLRGSGLKYHPDCIFLMLLLVSLFTREWIEISIVFSINFVSLVSLFTREWIEILSSHSATPTQRSLPLYEGVDWNSPDWLTTIWAILSPSLRGSGLKLSVHILQVQHPCSLPLYEGVDWNIKLMCSGILIPVSLFTREWIEILSTMTPCSMRCVSLFTREWIEIFCRGLI